MNVPLTHVILKLVASMNVSTVMITMLVLLIIVILTQVAHTPLSFALMMTFALLNHVILKLVAHLNL